MKNFQEVILELQDFRNFGGKSKFSFKRGLNLINAPNSSGKTSLINALELFVTDDPLKENLINKDAEKATIKLDTGEILKIDLKFDEETGQIKKLLSSEFNTNSKVHDLCFITENHHIMKAALDKDFQLIRNWLVNLTDFPYFQKAYEITIKQINNYEVERNKQNSVLYSRRKYLLSKMNELQSQKKHQENIYQSIINDNIGDTDFKGLFDKESELSNEVVVLEMQFKTSSNEIESFKARLKEEQKQLGFLEKELKEISKKEISAPKEIVSLEIEISEYQSKIKIIKNEIDSQSELFTNRNVLEKNLEEIEELITKGKTECPKCHSQITINHLKDEKKKIKRKIELLNEDIKSKIDQLESFEEDRKKLERLNTEIKTKVPKQKSEIEKDKSQKAANIRRIEKKVPELEEGIKESKAELEIKKAKYKQLSNKTNKVREEFEKNNEKLTESKARIKQINEQLDDYSKEITEIDVKTEELNKYDDYIENLQKITELIAEKIQLIQSEVVDTLNIEIAKMTKSFDFNEIKKIFIDDEFKINIQKTGNKKISYTDLSMFERKTIGVIIAFVLKKKFAYEYPFFVIDEYLNSLDGEKDLVALDYLKESEDVIILTKSSSENIENSKMSQKNITHIK